MLLFHSCLGCAVFAFSLIRIIASHPVSSSSIKYVNILIIIVYIFCVNRHFIDNTIIIVDSRFLLFIYNQ